MLDQPAPGPHQPYTVYDYTPTRSRAGPHEFLKDLHGYLQAGAYSGYDWICQEAGRGVTELACMAHVKRKYFEAQSSDIMRSVVVLAYIHLLYLRGTSPGPRESLALAAQFDALWIMGWR